MRVEPAQAIVEVVDRGVGIAAGGSGAHLRAVLPGAERRRIGQGFGLGLPIVRELVHAHGGRVRRDERARRRQHVPRDRCRAWPPGDQPTPRRRRVESPEAAS